MGKIDKVRGKSDKYEACSSTLEYKAPLSMVPHVD
jgi:hypothetical protein